MPLLAGAVGSFECSELFFVAADVVGDGLEGLAELVELGG
jgi:hypothetical protein